MAEAVSIAGGCLCGAVRYMLRGAPVLALQCHCSRCRKASGSAFAANLFALRDAFAYTRGEELLGSFRPPDAERFDHIFCTRCGSTLPFDNGAHGLVGIPMGTLDDDPGLAPKAHIWVDSKAPWHTITDDLPRHPEKLPER